MTIPNYEDAIIHGMSVMRLTKELVYEKIPLEKFFLLPEPGERSPNEMWGAGQFPWGILNGDEYDDGGGATIAAICFQRCV